MVYYSHVMKSTLLGLFALLLLSGCLYDTAKQTNEDDQNYVVLLSLDGFRWDYPEIYNTPVLDSIARNGVKANALIPCFPSKTFPNHYSIATGMYPDHHGLINNSFFNPNVDRVYTIADRSAVEDPCFYKGEPLWVTANKQGVKTASYFWIGSETKIKGVQPDIWKKFDSSIPFEQRIDSVIGWLQLPQKHRPHLITFYFEQPDMVGHLSGPVSSQTRNVVERIDSLVGDFCTKMNNLEVADSIDFIIVSDHGMTPISKNRAVAIDEFIPGEMIDHCFGNNPFFLIEPKEMFQDSVYSLLSDLEGVNVWRKDEIPDSLHYGSNNIIPSLVVCAKPGWSIYNDSSQFINGGTHGYSPYFSDMQGIFYGIGPSFKKNYAHKAFVNVEVYNLICRLLNLEPAANDGNFSSISGLLRN